MSLIGSSKDADIKNLLEILKLRSSFGPIYLQIKFKPRLNVCSQKFAMRGAVLEVWQRSRQKPLEVQELNRQPPEAGGMGAKPTAAGGMEVWGRSPQRSKNLHFFCKNNLILGLFW